MMMMNTEHIVTTLAVFVPIAALLLGGGFIALRSGVTQLSTGQDFLKVAGNFSHLVLRVAGYVAALIILQYCIGLRPSLGW